MDQANILHKTIQGIVDKDPFFVQYEIVVANNSDRFIDFLTKEKINILILVDYEAEKWIPLLELAQRISPQTVRIVLAEKWPQNSIISVINSGRVFRALNLSIEDSEIKAHLVDADLESETFQTRLKLKSIYAEQNRKLESLNSDLEKMVEEKTADIRKSKDQIDDKVLRVRQLTSFIKELSSQVTFQEFMTLIRRDIRKFSKTGDPILIIQPEFDTTEIIYFSSGSVVKQKIEKALHISDSIQTNDKQTAQYLADFFRRPVIQTLSVPLLFSSFQEKNLHQSFSLLCIEHSMNTSELKYFLEHIKERLQPMSMAVDRAFLQKELSHQYYRWEKTFDGIKDPIAIVDAEYGIIRTNKKFSDRIVHRACYEEFAGRTSICPNCPLEEALQTGQTQSKQVQINGKQYEVSSYPIRQTHEGKSTSAVNQYKDITNSRELYARLLQSEKMGAIGLLAGNIAHELNNPLTGIRSLTQVLIAETADQQQLQSDLKEIEKASARSQKIIRNLLEFSSGSTNSSQLISIDEIFDKTLPILKTITRNLRSDFKLDTQNALIQVEPQLIQQVIFNLIQNASQAMEGQKEPATLIVRSTLLSNGFVELSIQDSGPGIPIEIQQKIFEPFFTTKSETQGTGLGLSLSREILRRFGGELELISSPGKGALFKIHLPISKETK